MNGLILTENNGRSCDKNFGKLTSLIDLSMRISSSSSGYCSLRLPAAVNTDFTALIP